MSSDSKLFTTITLDSIKEVLTPLRRSTFYIITAESGYCPACHSDLSSANITAPNSLLGHLRRSKKCIAKREERGVRLLGLKQPDSLLWGSVDDLTALNAQRFPDRDLWVASVFPPTRPQASTPLYASVSQWNAQTAEADGYVSSSPPPSSSSSDDDWGSSSSSSSSGHSPTSSQFQQQYVMPPNHPNAYTLYNPSARRESNSTISAADYYAHKKAAHLSTTPGYAIPSGLAPNSYHHPSNMGGQPQQQFPAQGMSGSGLGMGIGAQFRAQQQQQAMPPQMYQQQQQVPQGMFMQPGQQQPVYQQAYQYPAPSQGQPGYSW